MLSRRSMMRSFGESGLSVFQAGQADWQRPHSVQVAKSSICFQVKCPISPDAEHGVLVDVLHVHVGRVVERPEGPGPAGEGDVDRAR